MRAIVTQRETVGQHGGLVDSLEREYVDFLTRAGFCSFPISSFDSDMNGFVETVNPDLVVLTGGGIVQADAYRCDIEGWHQDERDRMEAKLIALSLERGVPIFGICRGMQKLNAFFGGKLSAMPDRPVQRLIGELHPVECTCDNRFDVNHYHQHGVFCGDLGEGIEALATDPGNGAVEAFRHVDCKVIGVQWHPERMAPDSPGCRWAFEAIGEMIGREMP